MALTLRFVALMALVATVLAGAASTARADELSPDELLARYQPVTMLDRFERFTPIAVDGFIAASDLQRQVSGTTYESVEVPPAGLPVHGDGWRLDQRACSPSLGLLSVSCYAGAASGPSVVYGRYEVHAGTTVLQYWYFYDFDFWSLQYPPSDLVWQAHEGDWEVVTIVLGEGQQPVEAAYSQHCTGQRRFWAAVQKLGDHPVVFVAGGSHANLFAPGIRPIARTCIPPPALALLDQQGVVALDVVTPPFRTLGPGTTAVERIHDNAPRWLRFPGTFGETQWIHAPPPLGNLVAGAGPESPQRHDVWIDPLATIAGYPTA
jgi:hypothetical protein